MSLPDHLLIDTNVPLVANGNSPQPFLTALEQLDLEEKCVNLIVNFQKSESRLVLDSNERILSEYGNKLNSSGQPGIGDSFLRWVHENGWNPRRCDRRELNCTDESNQIFDEFPDHVDLKNFDVSDRKFIAAANAQEPKAPIFQAVDYKWWGWKDALSEAGIDILFIDEVVARRGYDEHH